MLEVLFRLKYVKSFFAFFMAIGLFFVLGKFLPFNYRYKGTKNCIFFLYPFFGAGKPGTLGAERSPLGVTFF